MSKWMLALAGAALLATGGCIKLDQEVTLKADGSADVKTVYGMSEQAIAQLEAMKEMAKKNPNMKMQSTGPELSFDEAKIREEFQKQAAEGVELKSCKVETKDGWKFATIEIACKDLGAASKAGRATGNKGGFSLTKNADGNYVLDLGGAKELGGDNDKLTPEQKAQQQQMAKAMMAGMRVAMKFNLPGDVLETTSLEKSGRSASLVLDISDDKFFEKSEQMGKKGAQVIFSGKGLNLKEFKAEPAAK
ncbi:MAG TPA: hypothetical protein PK280_01325 [Planctomycetota bacterium]|nr:hypothetical protein [Planctomycetota bacterium]